VSQCADEQAEAKPPALPIPTGIAQVLLASIIGGKLGERIAGLMAEAAALVGEDLGKANERFRKLMRGVLKGRTPRAATKAALVDVLSRGLQKKLEKSPRLYEQLSSAKGLFTVFAVTFGPETSTPAQQGLLTFSGALDQMGAAFSEAAEADNFAGARSALLDTEGVDTTLWAAPELGFPDAEANRAAVRGANNWTQLTRAAAPLIFNCSFCWLSLLDIATLSAGKYAGADFSLFLPLITQPSDTRLSPESFAADRRRLPVANLLRMLGVLAEDIWAERRRHLPASERNRTKGDNVRLENRFKTLKRHDFITLSDFNGVLRDLMPTGNAGNSEECWCDIYGLLLATNLFSLFTMRDGKPPVNNSRREAPEQIVCFPEIETGYRRWWQENRNKMTGDVMRSPRPAWITRLRAETGQTDPGH
jgi:hypothetical protein